MNNTGTGIWSEHNNSRSTVVIMYHICFETRFRNTEITGGEVRYIFKRR